MPYRIPMRCSKEPTHILFKGKKENESFAQRICVLGIFDVQ
jgi:hypothetical protein